MPEHTCEMGVLGSHSINQGPVLCPSHVGVPQRVSVLHWRENRVLTPGSNVMRLRRRMAVPEHRILALEGLGVTTTIVSRPGRVIPVDGPGIPSEGCCKRCLFQVLDPRGLSILVTFFDK